MSPLGCLEMEDLAAEFALGILPGPERADALAHLDGCHQCRRIVGDLADAVDAIVAAVPARRPSRSLSPPVSRLGGRRSCPRALVAAAAMVLALTVAVVAPSSRGASVAQRLARGAALAGPGVRLAGLASAGEERMAGVVFVQPSPPSWVSVTATDDEASSTYVCWLDYGDGHSVRVGSFTIRNGAGTWRAEVPPTTAAVAAVRILSPEGVLVAQAFFRNA